METWFAVSFALLFLHSKERRKQISIEYKIYLDILSQEMDIYLHDAVPAILDHGEGEQHDAAPHLAGQELHLGLVVRSQLPLAAQ